MSYKHEVHKYMLYDLHIPQQTLDYTIIISHAIHYEGGISKTLYKSSHVYTSTAEEALAVNLKEDIASITVLDAFFFSQCTSEAYHGNTLEISICLKYFMLKAPHRSPSRASIKRPKSSSIHLLFKRSTKKFPSSSYVKSLMLYIHCFLVQIELFSLVVSKILSF
jgi:hypothetical protein